jgi:hypothetical protein
MLPAMTETAASSVPSPDAPQNDEFRERATLIAFVVVAVVATVSWLVLLAWLAVAGLRSLGV